MPVSTQQTLRNRVNAAATAAQRGSTAGVDTNDPLFLSHTGEHYVWLPGTVGNRAYTVVSGAAAPAVGFKAVTDLAIRAASTQRIVYYRNDHLVDVLVDRTMRFYTRDSAGTLYSGLATTNTLPADVHTGTRYSLGFHMVNTTTARFYYKLGAAGTLNAETETWAGWTLLEELTFAARTFSLSWGNTTVDFVSNADTNLHVTGDWYGSSVYMPGQGLVTAQPSVDINTAGGPDAGQSSFTATTGQTVTVTRSATGLKTAVVTRPVVLIDGTDDYVQQPAGDTPTVTATSGAITVVVMFRSHAIEAALDRLWSSEPDTANGLSMILDGSGNFFTRFGGAVPHVVARPSPDVSVQGDGMLHVGALIIGDSKLYAYLDGGLGPFVSTAGLGATSHITPRLGASAFTIAASPACEIFACLTFNDQALTATQLDAIATALRGSYA